MESTFDLSELRKVRFDHRKLCRRLAELQRVRFDHGKACRKLAELRRVRFDLVRGLHSLVPRLHPMPKSGERAWKN